MLLIGVLCLLILHFRARAELRGNTRLWEMERASQETKLAETLQRTEAIQAEANALSDKLAQCRDCLAQANIDIAVLTKTTEQIPELQQARDALQEQKNTLEKRLSELSATLSAERRQSEEKIALLSDARERLTAEFKVLAEQIIDAKGKTFNEQSKAQMDGVVGPLREQLGEFKRARGGCLRQGIP